MRDDNFMDSDLTLRGLEKYEQESKRAYHDRMKALVDGGKMAEIMQGLLDSKHERIRARAAEMWFKINGMFDDRVVVDVNVFKANFAGFLKGRPVVDEVEAPELPEGGKEDQP